jgi:hemerythrin-like domain-containing protein
MNEAGMPSEGGPVGMMLAEHEQGREFTAAMKDAAEKWEKGDRSARGAVAHNALGYVSLLHLHIQKEDKILFPMAERAIPPQGQEKVDADFERVEADEAASGIYDKYLALAEVLEKESTRPI